MSVVVVESHGPVRVLTLNRPDKMNALTLEMMRLLRLEIANAREQGVRALILTGAGKGFCSGADLSSWQDPAVETDASRPEAAGGARVDVAQSEYWVETAQSMVHDIFFCPVPVIAAINGSAVGGAIDLALACDFRVAADSARFVAGVARLGLGPDLGGSWLLPRIVGEEQAKRFYLIDGQWSAQTALALGLVGDVTAPTDLLPAAFALAEKLTSLPRLTVLYTKRLIQHSTFRSLAEAQGAELDAGRLLGRMPDSIESVAALVEKRTANFRHNL